MKIHQVSYPGGNYPAKDSKLRPEFNFPCQN